MGMMHVLGRFFHTPPSVCQATVLNQDSLRNKGLSDWYWGVKAVGCAGRKIRLGLV